MSDGRENIGWERRWRNDAGKNTDKNTFYWDFDWRSFALILIWFDAEWWRAESAQTDEVMKVFFKQKWVKALSFYPH